MAVHNRRDRIPPPKRVCVGSLRWVVCAVGVLFGDESRHRANLPSLVLPDQYAVFSWLRVASLPQSPVPLDRIFVQRCPLRHPCQRDLFSVAKPFRVTCSCEAVRVAATRISHQIPCRKIVLSQLLRCIRCGRLICHRSSLICISAPWP